MRNKIITNTFLTVLILSVFTHSLFALPPDPDNAALLYYQSFCIYEKPDETMDNMLRDLAKGNIEPNPTIEKYVNSCLTAIRLAENASELSKCEWGMIYSNGLEGQAPYLSQARMLAYIILSDARIALSQGDYQLAIQRCFTARKLGIDVGQDPLTVGFLVEKAIENLTNECIRKILSEDSIDSQQLQQLKTQLDELDSRIKPLEFFLKTEQEVMAMYATPERIQELLSYLNPESLPCFANEPNDIQKYIINSITNADVAFCQRNKTYYDKHWSELFSAFNLPYQQAYNKLTELDKKVAEDYKENPDAFIITLLGPAVWKIYNNDIQSKTSSNAVKTAIELYLIKAQTGKLPDSLPAGLPKDLFSGKDFEYEKTADGFILRCRGKDLSRDEIYEYAFKVKK